MLKKISTFAYLFLREIMKITKDLFARFYLLAVVLLALSACNQDEVQKLYFTEGNKQMTVGQVDTLELFFLPIEATNYNLITWTSSDNSVVRVGQMGEVRAIYSGKCTITASYREIKATIEITVSPVSFDMSFSKAVSYFYGESSEHPGVGQCVLRLLSDGYEIALDGSTSGAGYYMNMLLQFPPEMRDIPQIDFYPSDAIENGTYRKGYFWQQNNATYVSGSFLGHTSIESSSATAIKDGVMVVGKNGDIYTVSATFIGDRQETIHVAYQGKIRFVDYTLPPSDTLRFGTLQKIENLGDVYSSKNNIFKATLLNAQGDRLQIEFVAPLSAGTLPLGSYRLEDGALRNFTLVPSDKAQNGGSLLNFGGEAFDIISGRVEVSRNQDRQLHLDILLHSSGGHLITD